MQFVYRQDLGLFACTNRRINLACSVSGGNKYVSIFVTLNYDDSPVSYTFLLYKRIMKRNITSLNKD